MIHASYVRCIHILGRGLVTICRHQNLGRVLCMIYEAYLIFKLSVRGVSVVLEIAVGIRVRKNKVTEKIEMKYLPNGLI
jgi:hypothetical protein